MATIVAPIKVSPPLTFDRMHVNYFTIRQPQTNNPPRAVEISLTPYALDTAGNKVFDPQAVVGDSTNIEQLALENYATLKITTVEAAIQAYAAARAAVGAKYAAGEIDDLQLMAYFELCLARVAEILGKATFHNIA